MKVVIAGSRSITDMDVLLQAIEFSHWENDITEVVCGGAVGVDTLGKQWAEERLIKVQMFLPDWELYGGRAGIVRNKSIARYADVGILVWDGKSKGTKHMIEAMRDENKSFVVWNASSTEIKL